MYSKNFSFAAKYGPPEDDEGNFNPNWTRQNLRDGKDAIINAIKEAKKNCPSPTSSTSAVASTKSSKRKK